MNFYEALSLAVNDGKKIRQTDWTKVIYATADETGQLHLYSGDKFISKYDDDKVTADYYSLAEANWELYTRYARFKDVNVGERFKMGPYAHLEFMRIKDFAKYNTIINDGRCISVANDACVEIVE